MIRVSVLVACVSMARAAPYLNATSAAAASWKKACALDGVSEAIGIAFASNTVGYVAGGGNGVGPEILKSPDGGASFTPISGINFGIDILLLDVAAAANSVIVTAVGGELYSLDGGKTFYPSIGGGLSQSIRYIGRLDEGDGLHFGIAGAHRGAQGVAITKNGGITFKSYDAKLQAPSRYGVYPSQSTWYVSAGSFPSPPPAPPPAAGAAKAVRRARKFEMQNEDGTWDFEAYKRVGSGAPDGYSAQISKTTDGGATWTTQFSDLNGSFYFNEIDCYGTDNCCAAGEAAGSSEPGVRIYCTSDAGATWTKTYELASEPGKASYTMLGLNFASPTEVWACGGKISLFPIPHFWHSTDAGKTWTIETGSPELAGSVCLGFDMKSPTLGFAALDNVGTQTVAVAKFSD